MPYKLTKEDSHKWKMLTDFSGPLGRDLNNARLRGLAYYLRTAVLVLQNNMKKTEADQDGRCYCTNNACLTGITMNTRCNAGTDG